MPEICLNARSKLDSCVKPTLWEISFTLRKLVRNSSRALASRASLI